MVAGLPPAACVRPPFSTGGQPGSCALRGSQRTPVHVHASLTPAPTLLYTGGRGAIAAGRRQRRGAAADPGGGEVIPLSSLPAIKNQAHPLIQAYAAYDTSSPLCRPPQTTCPATCPVPHASATCPVSLLLLSSQRASATAEADIPICARTHTGRHPRRDAVAAGGCWGTRAVCCRCSSTPPLTWPAAAAAASSCSRLA